MELNDEIILEFEEEELGEEEEVAVDPVDMAAARILSLGYQGAIRKIIHEAKLLNEMVNLDETREIDLADMVIEFVQTDKVQSEDEFGIAVSIINSLLTGEDS